MPLLAGLTRRRMSWLEMSRQYKAVPGREYEANVKPGTHALILTSANTTKGTRLFKVESTNSDFDGESDVRTVLNVEFD